MVELLALRLLLKVEKQGCGVVAPDTGLAPLATLRKWGGAGGGGGVGEGGGSRGQPLLVQLYTERP